MNVRRLLKLLIYFVLFLLALIAGVLVKAAGNNEFLPLVVHLPNSTALPVLTPTPTITPTPGPLNTGEITRVSVATDGTAGNMRSGSSDISSDGRYVVFSSYATNLVPNDTNGAFDIFIHDKETLETSLVSVSSSGAQGGNDSTNPSISSDGRFVAFSSYAYNLVPDNWDIAPDVYVHDRETGETSRVSVSSDGVGGNDWSVLPSISVDGTLVAFASLSNNLVIDDDNGNWDIFVHDRLTQQTSLVSVSTG
ncbi:MAG: WD40 domain protein beta Propeller, partial [candidate division WWE3 bacterium GW2011_GWB1_41_6]